MVLSALSNVLLITILIAILSNKFAEINANAQEEVRDVSLSDERFAGCSLSTPLQHLFQRVVKTVEGVKSDAVNIAALVLLLPLSWVCSPRTLHRVNVFSIRMTVSGGSDLPTQTVRDVDSWTDRTCHAELPHPHWYLGVRAVVVQSPAARYCAQESPHRRAD
jgi:hypothetical protein